MRSALWSMDYRLENLAKDVKIAGLDTWKAQKAAQEVLERVAVAMERANFLKEVELTGATHLLHQADADGSGLISFSDAQMAQIEAAMEAYKKQAAPPTPPVELDAEDWGGS